MSASKQRSLIQRWLALDKVRELLAAEMMRQPGASMIGTLRSPAVSMINETMRSLLYELADTAGPRYVVLRLNNKRGVTTTEKHVVCREYKEHEELYRKWLEEEPLSPEYNAVTTFKLGE